MSEPFTKISKDTKEVRLFDGTAVTPLFYVLQCRDSGVTFSPPTREGVDIYGHDGELCGSREGRFSPGSISFTEHWSVFAKSVIGVEPDNVDSLIMFLEGEGHYEDAEPTGAGRYTGMIRGISILVDGESLGEATNQMATFDVVRWSYSWGEADPDLLTVSGIILSDPVYTTPVTP